MKCVICQYGETEAGTTTVTLTREETTVVIRDVPAQICTTCGEEYVGRNGQATFSVIRLSAEALESAGFEQGKESSLLVMLHLFFFFCSQNGLTFQRWEGV